MEGLEMSMLTAQCDKLREMASRLEWEGFPLPDVTSLLRDAADTIESLRGQLTDLCITTAMRTTMARATTGATVQSAEERWSDET
jgi:hypothetical protein